MRLYSAQGYVDNNNIKKLRYNHTSWVADRNIQLCLGAVFW
jgi:hypothetical protein